MVNQHSTIRVFPSRLLRLFPFPHFTLRCLLPILFFVLDEAYDRQFCAKNLARDLDSILTDPEFHQLVKESASRISQRQETDTIELIDDVPSLSLFLISVAFFARPLLYLVSR